MSDEAEKVKTTQRISVSFTRKLSDGNYGGWEATAWVEGEVPLDATQGERAEAVGKLFMPAKAAVLDELGIKWALDEETGVLAETSVPNAIAVATGQARTQQQPPPGGGGGGGLRIMNVGQDGVSTDPIPGWLENATKKDGVTAVWDQRHTATGKQPLFKEAVPRGGVGKGKDGQAKGYWAP